MELKPLVLNPPLNVTVIRDVSGLFKLEDFFTREKTIGWDCETNPLKDFFWRKCRTQQFGNIREQYVIDLLAFCDYNSDLLSNCQGYYGKNIEPLKPVLKVLEPVLCSEEWLKLGVVLGFEYTIAYWNFGIRPWNFWDNSIVEKVIYSGYHSLKDYSFYGMEEMVARYFGFQIDKSLQESFTLDGELSPEQIDYAALDTRIPFPLTAAQRLIVKGFTKKTHTNPIFDRIDPLLTGDNLEEVCKIENDAIGSFQDLHIHGEVINTTKWMERVEKDKVELKEVVKKLDETFIPIVGVKSENITEQDIEIAQARWKKLTVISDEELALKKLAKTDLSKKIELEKLEKDRKARKEILKKEHSELKKKKTKIDKLISECEGEALINYGSADQLLDAFKSIKELRKLESTGDEVLEEYEHVPVVKLIQKYRELSKRLDTYGEAWAKTWVTKPCKEEGWIHPGDNRIHHVYNQIEADTGRSSSEKPNGQNLPHEEEFRSCYEADEGQVYITADMSGAELRILAELSGDPIWIGAFSRNEDVHSVGTEILYPVEWPQVQLPNCNYFKLKENGEPQRKKCKCPQHEELRNNNKAQNFLIVYGGGPAKLGKKIKKSFKEAKILMMKHERAFPMIWECLDKKGKLARMNKKCFDMFGRREILKPPTWEEAKKQVKEKRKKFLEFRPEYCKRVVEQFKVRYGRKPTKDEHYELTHREPTDGEISNALQAIGWGIERKGKNQPMQGTNATVAKLAMSILWHELPKYNAKLKKFVHDELVVQSPEEHAQTVAKLIGDAFKKAFSVKAKMVVMEFEFCIDKVWKK